MVESKKTSGFSYRPKIEHAARLERLVKATERTKAYFLDKALEKKLSEWEMEYAADLQKYDQTHSRYPAHNPQSPAVNERPANYSKGRAEAEVEMDEMLTRAEKRDAARKLAIRKKSGAILPT